MMAACSDWEEPAQPMIDDEETGEVELTIQTQVPGMEGASRAIPTEKITSITALAFDRDTTLIKVVSAEITPSTDESKKDTTGTFSVKVPLRTRSIHFIAKRDGEFTEITETEHYGKKATDLLIGRTSDELHYWAMLGFENGEDLKDLSATGGKLDLIRNFAKVKLNLPNDMDGHIAGFLNYNVTGTIAPSKNGVFGYQTQTNHAMPPTFYIHSDTISDRELGVEYYLFEEKNVKGDDGFGVASDLVYTICKIDSLYYKIAFKSDSVFRPIIRNQAYNITISKDIDKTRGRTEYKDAVNAKPVNDAGAKLQIHMGFDPSVVFMFLNEVYSVTVANIDSIQTLQIGYSQDFFGQGGIAIEGITPTSQETAITSGEKKIWVDTYTITDESGFTLTIDLDSTKVTTAAKDIEVQFLGEGENVYVNDILTVHALEQGDLTTVSPTTIEIPKTAGSTFKAQVTIPTYNEDVGDFELWVGDTEGAFTVTPPDDLKLLADGYYDVTEGQTYEFTFTLNEEGEIDAVKEVVFYVVTDYHRLVGTTTVTLLDDTVPEQDSYELWVENGAWNGSTGYNQFFTYPESITTGSAANLESSFYDDGANAHKSQHMVMGEGSRISFTISEQRYLTLLVAKNGDNNNTPSIKLMQGETEWTTTADANATTVDGTYNFGNGEIGTNGRLIRYELPAGTYTLQGSNTSYLLYYLRVSAEKPTMTDIVQPTVADYALSWSDNSNERYFKENDTKYFVDEEATNFTPKFKLNETSEVGLSTTSLQVNTNVWSFNNGDDSTPGSMQQTTRSYTNNEISSLTYNEGEYTLSGSVTGVNETSYKYAAFYDNLQLKPVIFNVKNTVKVYLYTSWDGSATPVTEFVVGGENNIIGFKMPQHTLPVNPLNSENIDFTIDSSWNSKELGAGIFNVGGSTYRIGNQANQNDGQSTHYHPRTEWTYKISWNNIPSNVIIPTSITDDVYFSYNGTISKAPEIVCSSAQGNETALNITLDFYADVDGDGNIDENLGNNALYEDLKLDDSHFYLKATIENPTNFDGTSVTLNIDYAQLLTGCGISGYAIHWQNSRASGTNADNIQYVSDNGTSLQFTIDKDYSEYWIKWVFKTGSNYEDENYKGTEIGFNYTVSKPEEQNYNLSGETKVNIAFEDEPVVNGTSIGPNGSQTLDWENYLEVNSYLPIGTKVTINFTSDSGGTFELHDSSRTPIVLPINYPATDGDTYLTVPSGTTSYTFLVTDKIKINGSSITYGINCLRINGTGLNITSIVAKYPGVTGEVYFNDGSSRLNAWAGTSSTATENVDGNNNNYLVLSNSNSSYAQGGIDPMHSGKAYEPGNYTLTCRIRKTENATGTLSFGFQHTYPLHTQNENGETNVVYETAGSFEDIIIDNLGTGWQSVNLEAMLSRGCDRLLFDFSNVNGEIHIDDLSLVRNQ